MNFAVRGFFSLFHLAVVFILWGAVYSQNESIGGFSFGQTLTYFLVMLVMQFFVGAFNEDYQISEEIRSGLINQFILKPINYFSYRFSIFLAARLVTGALILIPLLVAVPLLKDYLTLPTEAWRFFLLAPAMMLSALIQFSIAYCFGMLTFWFLEIQGFVILSMAIESDKCFRSICCQRGSLTPPNFSRFIIRRIFPRRLSPVASSSLRPSKASVFNSFGCSYCSP